MSRVLPESTLHPDNFKSGKVRLKTANAKRYTVEVNDDGSTLQGKRPRVGELEKPQQRGGRMSGDLQVKRRAKKRRAEWELENGAEMARREARRLERALKGEWFFFDPELQAEYELAFPPRDRSRAPDRSQLTDAERAARKKARRAAAQRRKRAKLQEK